MAGRSKKDQQQQRGAEAEVSASSSETELQAVRRVLVREFREREALADVLLTGLLSRENVFVLGPPGTGKTEMARAMASSFSGNFFWNLMTKVTSAEDLFGGIDAKAFRDHSEVRRNTKNRLPEAHIAVLDELPRASSAVLGTTFSILNERMFFNGGQMDRVPLMSAIATANHMIEGDELSALFDRFVLRIQVDYIKGRDARLSMIENGLNLSDLPRLSMEFLEEQQRLVDKVTFSDESREVLGKLIDEAQKAGLVISDRRWRKSTQILKAYAHLNGRPVVSEDDFEILAHVLWTNIEEVSQVRKIVAKVANPIGEQMFEIKEAMQALLDEAGGDPGKLAIAIPKSQTLLESFEKIARGREGNPKVEATQSYLADLHMKIVSGLMKRKTSILGVSLDGSGATKKT